MIEDVEKVTGRRLLVYYSSDQGAIDRNDVLGFTDLLNGMKDVDVDLMLQTPGGDIDAAEKIVFMCRSRSKSFRVIVPDRAKSAGTLIALAGDEIVMGDTSELGPIDPQIVITTAEGGTIMRPAQSYLDGLEWLRDQSAKDGFLSPAYMPLVINLDPALIDYCRKSIARSKQFAEKWLYESQCQGNKKAARKIARELANTEKYLSHGAVIDHTEATKIGLRIKYHGHEEETWQRIWRLHARYAIDQQSALGFTKIFESSAVSLPFGQPA